MIIHLSPILENGLIYLIFNSNLFISLIYLAYSSCIRQTDGWRWSMYSVAQSCPTRCDPMDCGTPGSSVHGISLARILQWISSPEDLPDTGIVPASLVSPALAGRFFITSATVEARWWKRWLFICQKWVLSLLKETLEKQVLFPSGNTTYNPPRLLQFSIVTWLHHSQWNESGMNSSSFKAAP